MRRLRPGPSDCPVLVCYPHAGGSASAYVGLARELAPGFEVVAVQYPGRQERRREQLIDDLGELTRAVVKALEPVLHRPVALFGHSMGALLAFETARMLDVERRRTVDHLFVSGRRAPTIRGERLVHALSDQMLISELRLAGGTPASWLRDPELVSMVLPVVRSDYRAVETYEYLPSVPVEVDTSILVGDTDPYTTIGEAGMWKCLVAGETKLHVLPGGHFYIDSNKAEVARVITDEMRTLV